MRAAAAVLLVVLALAGCGTEDAEPEGDPGGAQSSQSDNDCGSYESLNQPPTPEQEAMNRCLLDAFESGGPASLKVTLATVEGDAITHYFSVTEPGTVQVIVDGTKDRFGAGRWSASTCTGLTQTSGRLSWTGCAETEVPKDLPLTNPQQPS
jgi:hypothetical protein